MQRRINWLNYKFFTSDGYGRYGLNMVRALTRRGIDAYPGTIEMADYPGWLQRLAGLDYSNLTIQLMPAHNMQNVPGRVWGYSMYEANQIPRGWAANVNAVCERLLVPCEHNAQAFEDGGVSIPIHVIPGGTDPQEFPVLPVLPERDRPYTFLALGDRDTRKGIEQAWSAFFIAFENTPDVRLVIKTREGGMRGIGNLTFKDRRLSFWKEDLKSMAEVYEHIDCFVFPSFCEGWGMPPREAAMMGLPVIATRYSGLVDGIDNWAIPLNNFQLVKAQPSITTLLLSDEAQWALPDVEEVAAQMRWCYENRDAARARGLAAAKWLRENQTWDHSAKALIDLMEQYA